MHLRVAGAQIAVTPSVDRNIAAIERGIDFAARHGADVLLTPEGSLSGYTHEFDEHQVEAGLRRVTGRAQDARVGLALGTCHVEPADGRCYNQIRFYSSEGDYLGFHSKTLTCGSLTDPPVGEIEHYAIAPLQTFLLDRVTVGGLICNDLWANPGCTPTPDPHLSQALSRLGARVVFHAVNGGRDGSEWSRVAWRYHEANLRMRAQAGCLWIVTVDSCHPSRIPCSAPSGVVTPAGEWACTVQPQGERFFVHEIDLS